PYGRCTLAAGEEIATRNPLRYRAYYADAETGMFYLPARYYDPQTYRFLSQDPAAPSAGDPLSLNAYAYCLGDPVGASDPSGAIALWDDDNHVDSYEVAAHNATHAKSKNRRRALLASAARRQARWEDANERRYRFRVVQSPWFLGLNHVYVADSKGSWIKGMNGMSGVDSGWLGLDGAGPIRTSRFVELPEDMSADEFTSAIDNWDHWDGGLYGGSVRHGRPIMNDCHAQLRSAFRAAGVQYPGAPNGRFDWDDYPSVRSLQAAIGM
ncbi:MAG: RHS repeat-associated core domain-containing protein, partial [Thermoleophilia bacterium]